MNVDIPCIFRFPGESIFIALQVCHLSTDIERKNLKFSELFDDKKLLEEMVEDTDKRCSMYQNKIIKLESQLNSLQNNATFTSTEFDSLRRDFHELKLNKSKLRNEMEFLLDERDTRWVGVLLLRKVIIIC